MQNQKGFILPIVIAIVVVAILGAGGYFAYKQYVAPKEQINNESQDQTAGPALNEVEGWKTYTNTQYGFEIKYPSSWFYSEFTWNANINGIAFCPSDTYDKTNCADVPMMNTPEAPIFINTAKKPITSSSLILADEKYRETYNEILSTFKFTTPTDQTAKVVELSVWPDKNSFDLSNKTFEAKDLNVIVDVKVVASDATKIYRQSSDENGTMVKDYHDFQWLYSTMKNWDGPTWWIVVKGVMQPNGSILANEIFYTVQ